MMQCKAREACKISGNNCAVFRRMFCGNCGVTGRSYRAVYSPVSDLGGPWPGDRLL